MDKIKNIFNQNYIKNLFYNNKIEWTGKDYDFYYGLFTEYLNKKYDYVHASTVSFDLDFKNDIIFVYDVLNRKENITDYIHIYGKKEKEINFQKQNINKRFIIHQFGLTFSCCGGHQNCIVIDTYKKTLELYDPQGKYKPLKHKGYFDDVIKKIHSYMKKLYNIKNLKLLKPMKEKISFQSIELDNCENIKLDVYSDTGFCVIWTMFYIEQRIIHKNKDRYKVVKDINKKIADKKPEEKGSICYLISDYAKFIINLYNNLSLKEKILFNMKYNNKYEMYKNKLKNTTKELILAGIIAGTLYGLDRYTKKDKNTQLEEFRKSKKYPDLLNKIRNPRQK